MVEQLEVIVPLVKYNDVPLKFMYGDKGWQNLFADKQNFPAVYYFWPTDYIPIPAKGGYIGERYPLDLLFLWKSDLKWTPTQHRENAIVHAKTAVRHFISQLQHSKLIDEVYPNTVRAQEFMLLRGIDVGVSGVRLQIDVRPRILNSVCVT